MMRCFSMELSEEVKTWPGEKRQRCWLPLAQAKQEARFPEETLALLENAATELGQLKA